MVIEIWAINIVKICRQLPYRHCGDHSLKLNLADNIRGIIPNKRQARNGRGRAAWRGVAIAGALLGLKCRHLCFRASPNIATVKLATHGSERSAGIIGQRAASLEI
jgi:hypothetical protein